MCKNAVFLSVSKFLNATSAHTVPENGVEDVIKERKYNQGYFATTKYEKQVTYVTVKVELGLIK